MEPMLNLLAIFIIFGVAIWLVTALIPMPHAIKSLLNIVVLVLLILYVLQFFHVIPVYVPMPQVFR